MQPRPWIVGRCAASPSLLFSPPSAGEFAAPGRLSFYDVGRLTPEEFQLIETYLLRKAQLAAPVREQLTQRIMQRFAAKLEISPQDQRRPDELLEKLVMEYRIRFR